MPAITYGMFDTSNMTPQQVMGYQYMLNGGELYGEEFY